MGILMFADEKKLTSSALCRTLDAIYMICKARWPMETDIYIYIYREREREREKRVMGICVVRTIMMMMMIYAGGIVRK